MKYLIRLNCEYSISIDAENEHEAIKQAKEFPLNTWDGAWSLYDIEEEG